MIFYVPEKRHKSVRSALSNLRELDFEMDNSGASIVMTDKDFI
jgi:D-glycero-alpha-D-manno-heptose-7-phosphate kinase